MNKDDSADNNLTFPSQLFNASMQLEVALVASPSLWRASVELKHAAISRYVRTLSDNACLSVVKFNLCYIPYLRLTVEASYAVL